jgi:hypothetical protein
MLRGFVVAVVATPETREADVSGILATLISANNVQCTKVSRVLGA